MPSRTAVSFAGRDGDGHAANRVDGLLHELCRRGDARVAPSDELGEDRRPRSRPGWTARDRGQPGYGYARATPRQCLGREAPPSGPWRFALATSRRSLRWKLTLPPEPFVVVPSRRRRPRRRRRSSTSSSTPAHRQARAGCGPAGASPTTESKSAGRCGSISTSTAPSDAQRLSIRSRRVSPSASARSESRTTSGSVHAPPTQPRSSPSAVTSARSPTRAEDGRSTATTVASANGVPSSASRPASMRTFIPRGRPCRARWRNRSCQGPL